MITDSLLAYHHVPSRRAVLLLVAVALIGLVLLALAGPFLGAANIVPTPDDPLFAPFRWLPVDGSLG